MTNLIYFSIIMGIFAIIGTIALLPEMIVNHHKRASRKAGRKGR